MVFSSFEFIFLFLPLALTAFHISRRFAPARISAVILVLFSLYFYAFWKIEFLPVILVSIAFNYGLAWAIIHFEGARARVLMLLGISANVLYLGYFKYTGFLLENLNSLLSLDGVAVNIVLPLGISFFTFQQITYIVDIYRRERTPGNFIDYCLFVTFFPQLIAGPIVHHKEMMPQFAALGTRPVGANSIGLGCFIFTLGLAKKVLIADQLAPIVNRGFATTTDLAFHEAWVTGLGYSLQLYFDFSGYAAMAIGIGLLFGIRLPINFNSPYKAVSIQDFWRRWHITLSRFLRDYIYIPLGGNRVVVERQYMNLFLTFFIGGIWHGAAWTFVVWGALHGLATMVHRFWTRVIRIPLPTWFSWLITFLFVVVAFVYFRAPDFATANRVLLGMIDVSTADAFTGAFKSGGIQFTSSEIFTVTQPSARGLLTFVAALVISIFAPSAAVMARRFKPSVWLAVVTAGLFLISVVNMEVVNEFLYFDF